MRKGDIPLSSTFFTMTQAQPMESKLRCKLYPGQFASEFAVHVRSSSGREYSLFADKIDITYQGEPTEENPSEGWIIVSVVQTQGSLCLIRLPQSTLENGQFITVPCSDLDSVPIEQKETSQ